MMKIKQDECKDEKKHVWMYSTFCDRCEKYFDDWIEEKQKRVAFDILVTDLKQELDRMWNERKIKRDDSEKLYGSMLDLARDRGYI